MITKVIFENYKGKTGSQELTGFDLFIGRNGRGKSRVLEMLPFTMLGYIPPNSKNESETFKFSSSDTQMGGGIVLDTGFSCVRRLIRNCKRKKKTREIEIKYSQEISFSPSREESSLGQKRERIASEVGSFSAMFDFDTFLKLSGPERRKFIAGLSPIFTDKWDRATIETHLKKQLLTTTLKKNNLDEYKITEEMINQAIAKYPNDFSAQDGIQAILGWLKTTKDNWEQKAGDAEGVVNLLSEKKNQSDLNDRDLLKYKAEQDRLNEEHLKLEKSISADREREKNINARNDRINELNRLIEKLESTEISTDTFDIDAQIQETRQKLDSFDYSTQYNQLKEEGTSKKVQAEILKGKYDSLVSQKQNFEAAFKALKTAKNTIVNLKGCCIVDPERKKCAEDFTGYMDFVDGKILEGNQYIESIDQDIAVAADSYKRIADELQAIVDQMNSTMEAMKQANENNRVINQQLAELEQQKNERLNAIQKRDEMVIFYRNELVPLNSLSMAEPPLSDLTQAENRVNEINERLETVNGLIDKATQVKEDLLLIQKSLIEKRDASYRVDGLEAIKDELGYKGILGEIVKEAIEPLQANMQKYLKKMGFDYPAFFETESETGQEVFLFGWIVNDRRIYFDTLSIAQKIMYLAALVTVIVDLANPKTRVLSIDRCDDLDKYNFKLAIEGLTQLKPQYDNIILAGDVKGDLVFPKDWESLPEFFIGDCKVWNLTPEVNVNEMSV
jgi:exonuclease SbcC